VRRTRFETLPRRRAARGQQRQEHPARRRAGGVTTWPAHRSLARTCQVARLPAPGCLLLLQRLQRTLVRKLPALAPPDTGQKAILAALKLPEPPRFDDFTVPSD